ncbi:glycoside hydrolase family 2 protein [Firmicutes bacterium AM43-11BH]|nr:glycoside hydrolase family 2 protein [Firmicutes bacterium AM43-11BH]
MIEQKWNEDWKFWVDKDSFALVWDIPEIARDITLPHDAMIEKPANPDSLNGGNTGFRDGDVYTYVKMLHAPEEYKEKTIMLKFEGVYMNAFVYVNGQLAAKSPFGYTTFYAPLNDFLKYGEDNEIRVQVRAGAMTNSRWYSGAGIYRDVYLLESCLTHIVPEGVQVKTENADETYATLKVATELENKTAVSQELTVETVIKDADGNVVVKECTVATIFGQETRTIKQRILVEKPSLWSAENPTLYTYETKVYENAEGKNLLDEATGTFGIRTLAVDAKRGFRVNGETVNLRGGCIHHDSGLLGAATYEDAQYRQILKMKEAGFNAIRMSHHPMAPAMLRACDEIGMYVMDETFDMWNRLKSNYDYGLYFQEWWEKDVTAMVRKDYNHPSVILYSVGNEIPEIGTDKGAQTCQEISDKIRSLDDTRYTLASINGVFAAGDAVDQIVADVAANLSAEDKIDGNVNDFMSLMDAHMDEIVVHDAISKRLEKACAGIDVAGYNYMTARYEKDGETYPNRVIVGSETYPPEIARNWDLVERLPHVIGDFTWTGWDYIGEAGVGIPAYKWGEGGFGAGFPAQLAYPGDFDITGFRRPASYYREAVFGLSKKPYIAVQNPTHYGEFLIKTPWVISDSTANWNWNGMEGKPAIVEVYAQGDEVELFLNETSLGKKPAGKEAGFRTLFETTYEPGTLVAVSYENGQEIGRSELATVGAERVLAVEQEVYAGLKHSEQELVYVQVEMRDQNGVLAADDNQKITLSVDGEVEVLGFGSGNPKPNYNFNEGVTELFGGRAQIIIKKPEEDVTLTVTTGDGVSGSIRVLGGANF